MQLQDLCDFSLDVEDLDFRVKSLTHLRGGNDGFDQTMDAQGRVDDPFAVQLKAPLNRERPNQKHECW